MTEADRIIHAAPKEEDAGESTLRPQRLDDFTGQKQACANLRIFVEAARKRRDVLDHVLFYGPPGLGKTTLAQIVAKAMSCSSTKSTA
jgi:Holliday junction DNA helicase RuvB